MECYTIKKLLGKGPCGKSYLVEEKATKITYVLDRIDITQFTSAEYEEEVWHIFVTHLGQVI
jgi:hypothetical protein